MSERTCPCGCRPNGAACGEPMAGIELSYGECILCNEGDHWQEGDDEPAFDWSAIFAAADAATEKGAPRE